jgi:hypothetical protein
MAGSNTPSEIGTGLLGCAFWVFVGGGCLYWAGCFGGKTSAPSVATPLQPTIYPPPAAPPQQAEAELQEFTARKFPEVAGLLKRIDTALATRQRKIDALADAIRKVGDDPTRDRDYVAWTEMVRGLESVRTDTLALRKNAYLAAKKHEIAGANPQVDPLLPFRSALSDLKGRVDAAVRRAEVP